MESPLVSVIIPTYNRAEFLGFAISSILDQTYKNLQVIIVDDGSTDDTENVIKNFQNQEIVYIKQEHKGAPSARNIGIANSKGEYIAFLDSDDMWMPAYIEKQLEVFEKSKLNPGVVYCGIEYIDETGRQIREKRLPAYRGDLFLYLLGARRNVVIGAISTVLIKRKCFEECGLFDNNLPSRQDLDLLIRMSRKFTFDYVYEVLVKRRVHNKRISSNIDALIKGRELLFEKIYDELKKHRRILAKYYYHTAVLYLKKGNKIKHREYIVKSLKAFPLVCAVKALLKH